MTHVCSQLRSTFSQVTITLPASQANNVPFRPNPTFKPGWNRNVRCVTKIVPAWTKLPSWYFHPRCFGRPWFHRFLVLLPAGLRTIKLKRHSYTGKISISDDHWKWIQSTNDTKDPKISSLLWNPKFHNHLYWASCQWISRNRITHPHIHFNIMLIS